MLTLNEKRVLRFLATSIGDDYSINRVAKACGLTPNGAFKLLVKLQREDVLIVKAIANIKSYRLNVKNEKAIRVLELAFMPVSLEGRVKARESDLSALRVVAQACILFGSYITTKKEPGDLDVLFVLDPKEFKEFKKVLAKVRDIVPVKVQDVVQTHYDLRENIKRKDPVVMEALHNGVVLWGFDVIVKAIKHVPR